MTLGVFALGGDSFAADASLMLHNSNTTSSGKWGGDWGTATGQYGPFACGTCHDRNTTNIKRIRTSLTAPSGLFPGQGNAITFLDARDTTSDFGDDSTPRATSDKICEVCHSQNKYHNDDRALNTDNTHYNNADCTSCHKHQDGFKATCYACHGGGTVGTEVANYWPDASGGGAENDTPGRHKAHMDVLSNMKFGYNSTVLLDQATAHEDQLDLCGYCHANPGGGAAHKDTNTDTAFANVWDKAADADGSIAGGNCSNINCHNNKATGTGTYGWTDAGTSACIMCHNDVTSNGNATGLTHTEHANESPAIACGTCHDGATDWVGNTKPAADHLSGTLEISGTETLSYGGALPLATSFGSCAVNDCHSDGAGGPAAEAYTWGTATGAAACTDCHGLYPATNAHDAHYNAKGWTADSASCDACHDTTAGNHFNTVTDMLGTLGWASGPKTCSSAADGCHNGATSPAWDTVTPIACTDCHTKGGANTATVANPVSGLHAVSAGGVQPHDDSLTGNKCEECHVKASITGHWDGTASATADYTKAAVGITSAMYTDAGGTAATRGTCSGTVELGGCHSDGGYWTRQWSTDADVDISLNPNPGQAVCNVCHGQYASIANSTGWNAGTVHYRSGLGASEDKGLSHTDANPDECEDCHGYDSAATHNSNNQIDFSDAPAGYDVTLNTDRWYCANCHNDDMGQNPALTDSRTFYDSLAFPNAVAHVTGASMPEGACHACHGNSATGAYWPDTAPETADNAGSEDDAGEHVVHMAALAKIKYGETLAVLVTDTGTTADVKQKTLCAYCHASPGADGDHMIGDDAEVTQFQRIGDGSADAGAAASFDYDYAATGTSTCSNIDCHIEMPAPAWYGGTGSNCMNCHTKGGANTATVANPSSGLHNLTTGGTVAHDDSFGSGYGCETCHVKANITGHFNGVANSGDFTGAEVGVDTSTMYTDAGGTGASRGSCAGTATLGSCHSDGGYWGRQWSSDADDPTAYDITSALPARCTVCHGVFGNWAAGSSHAGTFGGTASIAGSTHNSQNPSVNPGATCVDCHVDGAGNHGDNLITLNNDPETDPDPAADVDPIETVNGTYCVPCHDDSVLPPDSASEVIPGSDAFGTVHVDGGPNYPVVSCFSGSQGCHGDSSNNWWPAAPDTDPAQWNDGSIWRGYPNRIGFHAEHTLTFGTLIAETLRGGGATPTQDELNATCRFCHPMVQDAYGVWKSIDHRDGRTDLYGGYDFPGADNKGIVSSGDPSIDPWNSYDVNGSDGYLYQLDDPFNPGSLFPIDTDGTYRQYLYDQRADSTVNHGTCSNIDCHSNAPFTPNWYGDEQPPGLVGSLVAATHDMRGTHVAGETDDPGSVLLTWTAPGDNGVLDGTAYAYQVRYRAEGDGAVTLANWNDAATLEAGGVASVLRFGQQQEMVIEGLVPGQNYFFGVRTLDESGNLSPVAATGAAVAAHADDVNPIFWGLDKISVHDEGGMLYLAWDAAKDHSLPLTYNVWHTTHSLKGHLAKGGDLRKEVTACYNEIDASYVGTTGGDYCLEWESTGANNYMDTGLTTGDLYNFLVRAEDSVGNMDDNTVVQLAMSSAAPLEAVETKMYLVDTGNALVEQADLANPVWPGLGSYPMADTDVLVFQVGSTLARESEAAGISFDIEIANTRRDPVLLSAEFGYMDPTFVRLGTLTNQDVNDSAVAVGKRATRVQKFSLSDYAGIVPAGKALALRLDRWDASSGTTLTLSFGTAATKGQLMATVQPYNHASSAVTITPIVRASGGYVDINWSAASANDAGQTVHYDVYGSADGGADGYPYVIGLGLDETARLAGLTWDTVGEGLTGVHDVQVKVETGDGYQYEEGHVTEGQAGSGTYAVHTITESNTLTGFDNTQDQEPPAPLEIKTVEARPKQGAVYLEWTAVGNDGLNHGTRASYYDVRYTLGDIVSGYGEANFTAATQAESEPVPQFSGSLETYELLGLDPDATYTVAMKACDSGEDAIEHNGDDNCGTLGGLSVFLVQSGPEACGFCHSTPPDEPAMAGSHQAHGFTLDDCAKCHGDAVTSYDGRHYNGYIDIGWARNSDGTPAPLVQLAKPTVAGENDVTISQTTDGGPVTIYQDTDGAGGYNAGDPYIVDDVNGDSGQCMNFGTANVTGCHGPFTPRWATGRDGVKVEPTCADCHGDKSAARDADPYGRIWDDNVSDLPSEEVQASPPIDNHGQSTRNDKYVGAHERHLNASFRSAKGDSCRLCHKDTFYMGEHANGNVDLRFDDGANKAADDTAMYAYVTTADPLVDPVSCGHLSTDSCHDTNDADNQTWPKWNEPGAQCDGCHGMSQMGTVPHISDGGAQACEWCHVAGHPQSPDGVTPGDPAALLVNNNPAVGINYRSGGIHLRKVINGRDTLNNLDTVDTLAEICWACHEDNGISEFGADDGNNNAAVEPYSGVGRSMFDFGTIVPTSWVDDAGVGASWSSAKADFGYKSGTIQSVHSTDATGQATITWNATDQRWDETLDPASKIRCTNCHDVHDLNKTPGDTVSGYPFLRGTWKSNPYEEDGAPWNKVYGLPADANSDDYGRVPRANTDYNELGGYYIDQNNVRPGTTTPAHYPTSGWTVQSSAGLCVLCHSTNVDGMDKIDDTGKFAAAGFGGADGPWYGVNGHSNSAVGGTFVNKANIFDYSHGRDTPAHGASYENYEPTVDIFDMGVQDKANWTVEGGKAYVYGYRSLREGYYNITIDAHYAYNRFNWGVTVDAASIDTFYHQFSCSKCHNPHASRLPKLMITNCLDVTHNTWDEDTAQGDINSLWTQGSDYNKTTAYWNTAQNCHRYDGSRTGAEKGGWNKVTPWVNPN